jgi:hypothetical protein
MTDQKFGGIEPNLLDEHPFREMYPQVGRIT